MGIFDFLSDLSSKRAKELDLGGLKSLLGTRKAAEAGLRGDEMMKITGNDSLPGYFNPETREYVPWYVDLFDGGGFNSAGGENAQAQAASPRQISPQVQPQDSASPRLWNDTAPSYAHEPYSGGGIISNSQMNQEMYGYDYPTEFPLGAEPKSLLSLERPIRPYAGRDNFMEFSQPSDYDILRVRPAYPAQAEFPLGAEPESLQSLERPIRPYAGRDNFMEFSQPSDRAIQRDMPAYPAQVFGVVGSDASMGKQVNPIPQVDAAEFQRFRSKFENLLKLNRQWGFPDREAAVFQALKAGGSNY